MPKSPIESSLLGPGMAYKVIRDSIRLFSLAAPYLMGFSALAAKSSPSRVILTSALALALWLTMSIAGTRKRCTPWLTGCWKLKEYMSICTTSSLSDILDVGQDV